MCITRAMALPAHLSFCCYLREDCRDEPAQETAADRLCPRRLSELQLSPILFQAVKLKWSQVQQKLRDFPEVTEKLAEAGPDVGPSLAGQPISWEKQ